MKITIIVPVFNEEKYILEILKRVNLQKKNYDLQIIISDDASTDKTLEIIKQNRHLYDKLIENKRNLGKGSAIINSLNEVSGEYLLIQDADLEYDPIDYEKLFLPALKLNADVVFGSRFQGGSTKRILYFKNRFANFVLSFLVSILTNINFSDVETGYKLIKSDTFKSLKLTEKSFAIEIEIVMKLAKKNLRFYEVGISYNGRTYEEGKKINFKDGLVALYKIFYYKWIN